MTCCNHCRDAEGFFNRKAAERELRRYRRRGPSRSTQKLLESLRVAGVEGATLLDIGGGIGAIQHELFRHGLRVATHVDASAGYLEVAELEAARLGHAARVTRRHGDFVECAGGIPDTDIVTLDRVVCCYPRLEALLNAAADRTGRTLGLVYPRPRWGTRVVMAAGNLFLRLRGSDFQVYLHPPARMEALLRGRGLRLERTDRTFLWEVATYQRVAS